MKEESIKINSEEKPRTKGSRRSKVQENDLHFCLNGIATKPSKKVINLEDSCAKRSSFFEFLMTTRSYENAHSALLWEFIIAHWNNSSLVDGHILARKGLDNMSWRTTLSSIVKNLSIARGPFVWRKPWRRSR